MKKASSGHYAAIEDSMIEESSESLPVAAAISTHQPLSVPPLAEEGHPFEGEEATENLDEISNSQIELITDPRKTNVIDIAAKQRAADQTAGAGHEE